MQESLLAVIGFGVGALRASRSSAPAGLAHHALEELGPVRRLLAMGAPGLSVMRSPGAAALAIFFQILGWTCQLFAVYTAMRAFDIHAPLPRRRRRAACS